MRHSICARRAFVFLFCASIGFSAVHAEDTLQARTSAREILEKGWGKSLAAHELVISEFDKANAISQDAPILLAAHWMALANQGRYPDSLSSLNKFLTQKPNYLPALQAKVFIHTVLSNQKDALDAAEKLAQIIAQTPFSNDEKTRVRQEDTVEFLGTYFGYLEEPVANIVNQEQKKKSEDRILKQFDAPRKQLFNTGKQAVFAKLKKLRGDAAEKGEAAKAAADKDNASAAELSKKEQDGIDAAKKNALDDAKREAESVRKALDLLNQHLISADNEIKNLDRRAELSINQLPTARRDLADKEQKAKNERNPQVRQKLDADASTAKAKLDGLEEQIEDIKDLTQWWKKQ